MTVAGQLAPVLSVAALALLAVLPWGLPADGRFVLPFLTVIAIFYWSLRSPERLPLWVPFVAGLVVDVLSNGPLGYWPLIYLASVMMGVEAHGVASSRAGVNWGLFAVATGALVIGAWGVASIYHLALADWQPFAWAAWCAALAYPLVTFVLRALDPDPVRPGNDRLMRGV